MWRVYILLGRSVSPLFVVGLRVHTFLTRQERVRVLVFNEHDEILLVRGVISDGKWSLPGGGIERGEAARAAAVRELREETGVAVRDADLRYIATLSRPEIRAGFKVPLFSARTRRESLPERNVNRWEISHIGWFKIDDLPQRTSVVTHVALDRYRATR